MQAKVDIVAVLIAIGVLVGAGAAARAADDAPIFDIPRLEKVVIDGKTDDWGDGGFRVDLLTPVEGALRPVRDHDARIRLGWNDDGLLMLVVVRDDKWVEDPDEGKLWQKDGIEVFLAPKPRAPDQCQWAIAPGMDPKHETLRWHLHDFRKDEKLKKLPAKVTAARTKTANGYVLEALLPWAALAIAPKSGREVGFQVWVNDADSPDVTQPYHATWYPATGTGFDSTKMHRVRLAERPSPPVTVRTAGSYDLDWVRTRVTAAAQRELAGKALAVVQSGKAMATGKLAADDSGRAVAMLTLPMPPPGKPYGRLAVEVDGKQVDVLRLADPDRQRAEALLWSSPAARPAVFVGKQFPEVGFERPLQMERLIGPYSLKTTFYDKDYNVVTSPDGPGRYGAVVEVTTQGGGTYRRFITLCRLPEDLRWWEEDLKISFTLPDKLRIRPEAVAAYRGEISEFVKWRVVESLSRDDAGAVLLAGLYETRGGNPDGDFYSSPEQRDRQWWVGLKRKLYGWDKQFPQPLVCPRPIEGAPALVVREGTAADAGMKPDAAAQIDAVLTQWANDTDEAFAVCIVRHGIIVLHKAYGTRGGKPMTVTTKSWMASTTKMISGACMMMLVNQGLIDLDDRADKYLPPLRGLKTKTGTPLTIRHLYTHTNGMDWHWGAEADDMEERIAALIPHYEVGVRYAYNGTGMELACKILEAVTGESLPNFYRSRLLGPLGCRHTDIPNASSGAMSVPLDMAKIGQMLLNRGAYGRMRFMSEETFEKMLPRKLTQVLGPKAETVYGIGTSFHGDKGLGEGTFAHGAASAATTRIDPVNDLVISMTRNAAGRSFQKYHQRFIDAIVEGMIRPEPAPQR